MSEEDVDSVLSILGQAHSPAIAVEGDDIGDDEQVQIHHFKKLPLISLRRRLEGNMKIFPNIL